MDDYGLVLNAGSSSLKFSVFHRPPGGDWTLASRGQIDGIGSTPRFTAKDHKGETLAKQDLDKSVVRDANEAVEALAQWLRSKYAGSKVLAVGHRVVHGGAKFTGPTIVTPGVLKDLYELVPLAPLHQPYNLAAIEAATKRLPGVPQVACFDTSFHRGHEEVADVVPLPQEICGTELQRYGFHGLSYEYIAETMPQSAPEIAPGRVIVAHLGSGASMCAMNNCKSVDSTLGFTALDGLCMGTRPGALDPGVVLYLFQNLELSVKEVETILYKKSGLLGISGISNDMRELLDGNDPRAKLAIDYFVYQAAKQIGALTAVLRGIDGLVFTAGIGENSYEIRKRICAASEWLGIELDDEANKKNGLRISTRKSKISVWVIPTNEELIIARHTGRLLGIQSASVAR